MKLRPGGVVGLTVAAGAWISSGWSSLIPEEQLGYLTSGMLFASGFALWFRMAYVSRRPKTPEIMDASSGKGWLFGVNAPLVGFITGALSGLFGIGSTPFIQLGLMLLLGMSMRYAAGTTMLVIMPIALAGGAGYITIGYLDVQLLATVVIGTMTGAYIGAKLTKRVPAAWLKTCMVLTPMLGGAILLF